MCEEKFIKFFPGQVKRFLYSSNTELKEIQEIKLRNGKPLMGVYGTGEVIFRDKQKGIYIVTEADLKEMIGYISSYSLYAYEEEMRQGFITIEGGHRIGICGQVIMEEGHIKNLRYISSINVRIAHEVYGCADRIIPFLLAEGRILHTLIISPPRCGKTTLLRDIIRQISDGNAYVRGSTIGVVDERSEIGGCYRGVAQNQLGIRTDILDGCPKSEGMLMLIRAMGPEVIAVDEIGTREDVHAVDFAMHCGCKMIATVHGNNLDDLRNKPVLGDLIKDRRFERYVILGNKKGVGSVEGIYDENGRSVVDCGGNIAVGNSKSNRV